MKTNQTVTKLINLLLDTRSLQGTDSFQVVGTDLLSAISNRTLIEATLIHLDKNGLAKIMVLEGTGEWEFNDSLDRKVFRYKDWPSYHLNDDPITIKIDKNQARLLESSELSKQPNTGPKKFTRMEDDIFCLDLANGETKIISFHNETNSSLFNFFSVLYDDWRNSAILVDGWFVSELPKKDFVSKLSKMGVAVSDNWLKNTKSNLLRTKIKKLKLDSHLDISFNSKRQVYGLKVHQ